MNQLTIEGKKLPFTLNILALKNFSKHLGYNKPSQIDERFKEMDYSDISFDDFDLLAAFVFYGLEEGHRMAKKAFKGYSVDEILLKMSENPDIMVNALQAYSKSVNVDTEKKPVREVEKA